MKKIILLVFSLLLFGACTYEYKNLEPEPTPIGVKVQIDSAQWTPVLVKEDGDDLYVYDGNNVKKILLIDPSIYLLIIILGSLTIVGILISFDR